jgi:hypothetical protein
MKTFIFLLTIITSTYSQKKEVIKSTYEEPIEIIVIGKVVNKSGNSMYGVSVQNKILFNEKKSVYSDFDGSFIIKCTKSDDSIIFNFSGYRTLRVLLDTTNKRKIDLGILIMDELPKIQKVIKYIED